MTSSRPALIVKGARTGLGDRIRTVLTGALYAELSGRAIIVDWRDGMYGLPGENVFDRLFTLQNLPLAEPAVLDNCNVAPAAWRGRLRKSMHDVYTEDDHREWDRDAMVEKYSIDLGRLDYSEHVVVIWEFTQLLQMRPFLPGPIRNLPAEELERWAWRRFVQLSGDILSQLPPDDPQTPGISVGVHIRATDEFAKEKGAIPLMQYFAVLDELVGREKVKRMVVATDNEAVLTAVRARYPMAVARGKWFPAPGEPLHLLASCPDRREMARDALLDLALLAGCDWLVTGVNSSFGAAARIMSTSPASQHVVLAPEVKGRLHRLSQKLRRVCRPLRKQ